ncbi:hypothetical protein ACHHYP_13112 [Achlya hypogyna]|uniref:CCHC-type domain-containing protein n=1 Tax=Achlya hypogyna TaxID=1202772 RepID=A0A1V9YFW7_ACHHY|nr:hypothetical protein ACHHYP_13112 [Achlya hypogyna]
MTRADNSDRGRRRSDAERAAESGGVVLVTQLAHPKFTSIGRKAVVAWKRKREQYLIDMREQCRRQDKDFAAMCVPVKSSFYPDGFLENCLGSWDLLPEYTVATVTDDILMRKINKIASKVEDADCPDYDLPFAHLKLDQNNRDVSDRVGKFIFAARRAMEEHGLTALLDNNKKKAKIFKAIVAKITSELLDNPDRSAFNIWSLLKIIKKVIKTQEKALELNDFVVAAVNAAEQNKKRERCDDHEPERKKPQLSKELQDGHHSKFKKKCHESKATKSTVAVGGVKHHEQPKGCWHCGKESHMLKECKIATKEQKEAAVKKHYKGRFRDKKKRMAWHSNVPEAGSLLQAVKLQSQDRKGYLLHTISDELSVPYVPDSSSTLSIIPKSMVDKLCSMQEGISVIDLEQPKLGFGVGKTPVTLTQMVQLRLQLHTTAGTVNVPGLQPCYIVLSGDEFILSTDVLKLLGINIDRLLENQP